MKNLSFNFASNSGTLTNVIPFCVEVIQNSNVIARCFSSEGNLSAGLAIKTIQFDDSIATTIKYYNLGKKTNNISCILLNGTDFSQSTDSFSSASDGTSKSVVLGNNNFPNYHLGIACSEVSNVNSGVTYSVSGDLIVSAKSGDSSFVSSSTPNVVLNPNYTQQTVYTAPIVERTSIVSTDGNLKVSGMQQGDIFTIYDNNVKITSETVNAIIIGSLGQIFYPVSGYSGHTLSFSYFRNGVESARSQDVTVTGSVRLEPVVMTSLSGYTNVDKYINEQFYIDTLHSSVSTLVVLKGNGSTATLNTDYSITTLNQPAGKYATITFLVADNYQLQQAETNFTTSIPYIFSIDSGTRSQTTKPILTVLGKSISVALTANKDNAIELWYKNAITGVYVKQGNTVNTGLSPYIFNNLAEGTYKVKVQESDKTMSVFSDETTLFLNPAVVGSLSRKLGETISLINLSTGDNLEVAFSINGVDFLSTLIENIQLPVTNDNTIFLYYFYVPSQIGYYKFKKIRGTLSSEFSGTLQISNAVVSTPILSKTSMQVNGTTVISNIVSGDSLSYTKDGTTNVTIGVVNATTYDFTIATEGIYQFKLTRNGVNSDFSTSLAVINGTQCILSDLVLVQNTDNPILYDVTVSNPQNVVIGYILKNSSQEVILNDTLITSPTSVTNKVKGQIDFSNVIEGTGYQLLLLSITTGKTCSVSSDNFDFNIVSDEPIDVVLSGDDTIDCKGIFITQVTESLKTEGLEISFNVNYNSTITNNPPYLVSIMKQDGTELFQDGTNKLTSKTDGKLRCVIPYKNIPNKFTVLTINAVVSSENNVLSDVYGCVASADYTVTSDTQVISKSDAPILDVITINSNTLSFKSNCSGSTGKFFVNNEQYTLNSVVADDNNIISTPITSEKPLKVGDVITAKQICPNKLESDSSGSITILSTCTKVSGGTIEGDSTVLQNSVKLYKITGLQGSSPYTYETQVSGGEILSGSGTSEITVKITSNTSCIIGFKVSNCDGKQSVSLTKSVLVSQVEVGVLTPPRILGLSSNRLTGIADKLVNITLYNENNEIIANNIKADDAGVWNVNNVKKQLAYYAIAFYQNSKSNISNIFVVEQQTTTIIEGGRRKKQCNTANIIL